MKSGIAIVLPSSRENLYKNVFLPKWKGLFEKHEAFVLTIRDGEDPKKTTLQINNKERVSIGNILGKNSDLVCNRYAGVRSLGIAYVGLNMPEIEYIVCLDDDVSPVGDPIQDHIDALSMRTPISWMPIGNAYTRGFPYDVRQEAEVVLSHGVWEGIVDFDAPTQLVNGSKEMEFYKMTIPKGVLAPISYMNTAFKRKLIPYIFMCPQIRGELERCDDIWCSIEAKRVIDRKGWAMVTGYSRVLHERASDVFSSLVKESKFIQLNEGYWKGEQKDPYFKMYHERRKRWENLAWR
ncbi:MAG: UDP-arabinopyranose mutase 3 [Candidatus Daviesbacteria bacterium GW2011_GWB1_41_5]|uniref:UDP-arabinopyranose mutase 3 n=1 Tax=Candidatus Daviesbacteria bacterium GW2011_GWB1_41_5 TaxID=1618429 RepID=A0A0G0WM57_9BACT|nr:MAG: UDP-arabinopyranose mutase 3 [Candidatus Daviesbacteria bacterium GW2011_GWB1_41_5]